MPLRRLVDLFDADPYTARRMMRNRAEFSREDFYREAVALLATGNPSRGARYVVALLMSHRLLVPCLCDPSMRMSAAVSVARAALQVDGTFDAQLAHHLAEEHDSLGEAQCTALLHIVGEVSDPSRFLSSLTQLLRHPSPKVRSKAALLVGRGNRSVQWVQKHLLEDDPRVRANAVEALWSNQRAACRQILREAASDSHNRVAGNAVLALHRLGECGSVRQLRQMAAHASPAFRATAAWIMGETEHPRFGPLLAGLLGDPDSRVRRRAFQSLAKLRRAQAGVVPQLRVILGHPAARDPEHFTCRVSVLSQAGAEVTGIPGTRFRVAVGGREPDYYDVAEEESPEAVAVAFILPRGGPAVMEYARQAVARCAEVKRRRDVWTCLNYGAGGDAPAQEQSGDSLRYTCALGIIHEMLSETGQQACAFTDIWDCLHRAITATPPTRGGRHVIVFTDTPLATDPEIASFVAAARRVPVVLHGLARHQDPTLGRLCHATGGSAAARVAPEKLGEHIERLYLGFVGRYRISWRDDSLAEAPPNPSLAVQVIWEGMSGEGTSVPT